MASNSEAKQSLPVALTIAGFDPSGGAGVIADVGTFSALRCLPAAAITSLTFQNDRDMTGAEHLSAAVVCAQVMAVTDQKVAGAKTGMLPTREIVHEVARLFQETNLPAPVVDPVMHSTSGQALIDPDALETLIEELLPLARLITPNIPEAERITGLQINDEGEMRRAAKAIRDLGARAVLIKGGHLRIKTEGGTLKTGGAAEAIDVLDVQGSVTIFRSPWIEVPNVRGTGCRLSAAIAACLANGMSLEQAVVEGKSFVNKIIAESGA